MNLDESLQNCSLFSLSDRNSLRRAVVSSVLQSEPEHSIVCAVRQKTIKLTPEEMVRQLYVRFLIRCGIPRSRILFEQHVQIGSTACRTDISLFGENSESEIPDIIVEVKKPGMEQEKQIAQLKGYCIVLGVKYGVFINGKTIRYFQCDSVTDFYELNSPPLYLPALTDGTSFSVFRLMRRIHAGIIDLFATRKKRTKENSASSRGVSKKKKTRVFDVAPLIGQTVFQLALPFILLLVIGNIGTGYANSGNESAADWCQMACGLISASLFAYIPAVALFSVYNIIQTWRSSRIHARLVESLKNFCRSLVKTAAVVALTLTIVYVSGGEFKSYLCNPSDSFQNNLATESQPISPQVLPPLQAPLSPLPLLAPSSPAVGSNSADTYPSPVQPWSSIRNP